MKKREEKRKCERKGEVCGKRSQGERKSNRKMVKMEEKKGGKKGKKEKKGGGQEEEGGREREGSMKDRTSVIKLTETKRRERKEE